MLNRGIVQTDFQEGMRAQNIDQVIDREPKHSQHQVQADGPVDSTTGDRTGPAEIEEQPDGNNAKNQGQQRKVDGSEQKTRVKVADQNHHHGGNHQGHTDKHQAALRGQFHDRSDQKNIKRKDQDEVADRVTLQK